VQLGLQPHKSDIHQQMGMWVCSTKDLLDHLLPLERHITHIVGVLKPRVAALTEIQRHNTTDVLCYFASQSDIGGFDLSPTVLRSLGELGLALRTDEYFCCVER
jgi:hypothetical protein